MKVGTDGVLLGAWACGPSSSKYVLDIGSGTGLLSLMMAQRFSGTQIDAVEIEEMAASQSRENVEMSDWKERIRIHNSSFQEFAKKTNKKYDLIICNPPFFTNSMKSISERKEMARHDFHLNLPDLFSYSSSLISESGRFNLILPFVKEKEALNLADENSIYCRRITRVRPTPEKGFKRILLDLSQEKGYLTENELVIEEFGRHGYSEEYRRLTSDFYL